MSNKADRREKLRQRMQEESKNRDQGGKGFKPILDFSGCEDVNWLSLKKGNNEIDIFPFEITTEKNPQGYEIGEDHYKLDIYIHKNVGPNNNNVLCLKETFGQACPICEAKQALLDAGADWKDEEVKALHAKRRCYYNAIDLNDTEKGMQILDQSHFMFEKELFEEAESSNPDFVMFADFEEGYTIKVRGAEETYNGKKWIKPKSFSFEPRDPYDEKEIREQTYPLDAMLIIPSYKEVEALFLGVDGEEEKEEKSEPKKEKASRKPKGTDRTTAKEDRESTRSRRGRSEPEPEPEIDNHADDLPDCYVGHTYGEDWDNTSDCDECPHFDACGDRYEELEEEKKKAEEAEAKEKEKPAGRRRSKRG